ncbi:GNAT family N-acetyltransferase [Anaeromyxobacter oryzisoli]|uniref:GNAT family N-acetyltransferase n=1 Tax=Anaeromyxobacter oryzisoli TaxID=2925408 RepID=UPI001F582CE7|nr:GNAT family N-acetyltransferase [Anaeromyxobacter sp. SG63]
MTITTLGREDADAWSDTVAKVCDGDVFFAPEYVAANECVLGGTAECFVYEERGATVVYPYIKRPIDGSGYFDISSPYGYGGHMKSPRDAPVPGFAAAFHEHCRDAGIVSEFVRYNPLYGNHRDIEPPPVAVSLHQSVVCAELRADGPELRAPFRKEVAKKLRKARDAGLEVIDDAEGRFFEAFTDQYRATMRLRGAAPFYFFPDAFYASIEGALGRWARLLVAVSGERIAGTLLILHGPRFAYNYLSSSDPDFRALGTNDLLQVAALQWALNAGKERYLLGGGLRGEDSLFQYKARFADGRAQFHLGRRVHLPDVYERLCDEGMQRERSAPDEYRSRSWFPLYRSQREATSP